MLMEAAAAAAADDDESVFSLSRCAYCAIFLCSDSDDSICRLMSPRQATYASYRGD